jgi:hypothetical protein
MGSSLIDFCYGLGLELVTLLSEALGSSLLLRLWAALMRKSMEALSNIAIEKVEIQNDEFFAV